MQALQCTALTDKPELAPSSVKAIMHNRSYGFISCTAVLRQLARTGPSGTQWVGWLLGEMLALAHDANVLSLPMG